jgi:hypothetical protein
MYRSERIYMDEDMATVITRIGEAKNVFEAPSCAFDGVDRIFDYPGIYIHTYPSGNVDFVYIINFRDDSLYTPEGITLGSSMAEVTKAYGTDFKEELGVVTYTRSGTFLSFTFRDEMVVLITYGLVM